jgi:lipoteichoic acid synthase
LPTIANLFDIKHDPRLFMGVDLYGEDNPIVVFYNGSWYDEVGYFNSKSSSFKPFNSDITYTSEEIRALNENVKQKLSVSSKLYTSNYFNKRSFIRERALAE